MIQPAYDTTMRCAIHVHSCMDGDGEAPIPEIVAAARDNGVDALLLTDHDHAYAAESGWHGYQGNLLLAIGAEFECRTREHLLAFGLHQRIATKLLSAPKAVSLLKEMGGTVFVSHPQGRPPLGLLPYRYRWDAWEHEGFAGIEAWSYMHDWVSKLTPTNLPRMCRQPDGFVTGPDPDVLAKWDEQACRRRVAAMGGLDAHGRKLPLGLGRIFRWARHGILPYAQNFAAFSHYALVPAPKKDFAADEAELMRALVEARGWVCHDALGSGRDFRYVCRTADGQTLPVGSELPYANGLRLEVSSPQKGLIRLWSRGAIMAEAEEARSLSFEPAKAGEYRATVHLDGKFWILSNHIYLREATAMRG